MFVKASGTPTGASGICRGSPLVPLYPSSDARFRESRPDRLSGARDPWAERLQLGRPRRSPSPAGSGRHDIRGPVCGVAPTPNNDRTPARIPDHRQRLVRGPADRVRVDEGSRRRSRRLVEFSMESWIDGSPCPVRLAARRADRAKCRRGVGPLRLLGMRCVRNTALERKWSAADFGRENASALLHAGVADNRQVVAGKARAAPGARHKSNAGTASSRRPQVFLRPNAVAARRALHHFNCAEPRPRRRHAATVFGTPSTPAPSRRATAAPTMTPRPFNIGPARQMLLRQELHDASSQLCNLKCEMLTGPARLSTTLPVRRTCPPRRRGSSETPGCGRSRARRPKSDRFSPRRPHRRAHCRLSNTDAPPQRIRQQIRRERAQKRFRVASSSAGAVPPAHRWPSRRQASRLRPPPRRCPRSRHRPVTSKFSSANPSGSITRWHDRTGRIRPMLFHPLARRQQRRPPASASSRRARHVRRRRRRRRAEQHFHDPLAAQHRRGPIGHRGQRQDAALSEQAAAISSAIVTRWKSRRRRSECRSASPAARSRTCSRPSADRARCDLRGRCCRRRARFPA